MPQVAVEDTLHSPPLQHPLGQLVASQTQEVPSQRWPETHAAQVAPAVPQVEVDDTLQVAPLQQPVAQLVESQTHAVPLQR